MHCTGLEWVQSGRGPAWPEGSEPTPDGVGLLRRHLRELGEWKEPNGRMIYQIVKPMEEIKRRLDFVDLGPDGIDLGVAPLVQAYHAHFGQREQWKAYGRVSFPTGLCVPTQGIDHSARPRRHLRYY